MGKSLVSTQQYGKCYGNLLLNRILGFRIAPPVVGRVLNLTQLKPVTSEKLLATYFKEGEEAFCMVHFVMNCCA